MSLLQTLSRCAFALCCNLLFQFLPAVPCLPPASLGDPVVFPVFPLQVCPCLCSCHPPACPTAVPSVWGGAAWVLIGSQLLLTEMNCPVSALTGGNKDSVPCPDVTGLAEADQGGAGSAESGWKHSSGTHRVTAPFAREALLQVLGLSSISILQTNPGYPGCAAAASHLTALSAGPGSSLGLREPQETPSTPVLLYHLQLKAVKDSDAFKHIFISTWCEAFSGKTTKTFLSSPFLGLGCCVSTGWLIWCGLRWRWNNGTPHSCSLSPLSLPPGPGAMGRRMEAKLVCLVGTI